MRSLLFLASAVVLVACTSSGADQTDVDSSSEPVAVASQWLDAVAAIDVETLDALVEPVGLVVLAGVENLISSDEMVGLLEDGFGNDLAAGYWTTFRDDFAAIRGSSIETVAVGSEQAIEGRDGFVAVSITLDGTTGQLILRKVEEVWRIDLAATVGPALAGLLGEYLASALTGDNAIAIAEAYRSGVIPGLETAIVFDEANADLVFETEYLRQLVADALQQLP